MQSEQDLPVDYKKLWMHTLLFKKNNRVEVLNTTTSLLSYKVIATGLCYTLDYVSPHYVIDKQQFNNYDDVLAYMWLTISK